VGASPPADHAGSFLGADQAADGFSGLCQVQYLRWQGDLLCLLVEGTAAAVVAFVLEAHGVLHVRTETEAGGEVGGDLAVRGHRLVRHRPAPGGERGQAREPCREGGVEAHLALGPGQHAAGAVRIDHDEAYPVSLLRFGEVGGQQRTAGAAADVL
jgi:hypothetical protein